jgi:hypothetical protein
MVQAASSLQSRIRKSLAANQYSRFTRSMSGTDNAGSKLSAYDTRQHRTRRAVPCVDNLARVAKPPVASPLVPPAAADTVPVSARSALPPAPYPVYKRSGSQKRQRSRCVGVWLTDEEYADAETRARRVGLSLSSYGRLGMIGTPGPRQAHLSYPCGRDWGRNRSP